MSFRSVFDGFSARSSRTRARQRWRAAGEPQRPRALRPLLEALEGRDVPSFTPAVSYPAGLNPQGVVAADFDGDGQLDLATANYGGYDISVLLGNGDGSFRPAASPATDWTRTASLAVGDLNGDGRLDLAEAGLDDVRVLFGNGDGTFQPTTSVAIGSAVGSVAVGDLNGDGKLDLGVVSNVLVSQGPYDYDEHYEATAHVLLGDGRGNFAAPNSTAIGWGWHDTIALADFNRDGVLDLAAGGQTLAVLLNDGTGHLQAPTQFPVASNPQSVAAGDINEDGKADLVTGSGSYGYTVSVLLGDGAGGFGPAQFLAVGNYNFAVVVKDFNNDGHLDVVATNYSDTNISVLLGRGDASFLPRLNFPVNGYPRGLTAGDFNGDGWLDAAVGNDGASNSYPNNVAVLLNDQAWPRADQPVIRIGGSSVTEGNAGVTNDTFTVTLSKPWNQPVTVEYFTSDGTATAGVDYQSVSGTLTFAPGQTRLTFDVPVYGDRTPEGGEYFYGSLRNPSNATIDVSYASGGIVEDEPTFRILEQNDVSVVEGNSGITRVLHYTVQKSGPYDIPVTVTFGSRGYTATLGSDYQTGGTLTFAPNELSKTFDVTIYGDRLAEETVYSDYDLDTDTYSQRAEPHEYFSVALLGSNYGSIMNGEPLVYIQDDEPRISISDVTKPEGKKGQTTLFTFEVKLSVAYDQPVTMSFRTVDGTARTSETDYVAKTGMLTFAPGETTKTITIEVKGDSKREATEYFYLDLFGNSGNTLFTKSRGTGWILNDD